MPDAETWLSHRVSYGETDAMGIVYYAEYLHLFERSRSELIREHGMSYQLVEERGVYLPVREASCRYKSPSRYDELIWIHARISQWRRASIVFEYEIWDEARETLRATGGTQHAVVNGQGRPVRVPEWLRELFNGPVPN